MRLRLLGLLLVACAFGALAATVGEVRTTPSAVAAPLTRPAAKPQPVKPCPLPAEFRSYFRKAAEHADVPLAMLVAVARIESNLRPDAQSPAGAHGLLQVMPTTAAELDLDVFVTAENVLAGAIYLRQMLDRFKSVDLALAAYNAGPSAVEETGGPPSTETMTYVSSVNRLWRQFAGCS